jgi:hypothetical protein
MSTVFKTVLMDGKLQYEINSDSSSSTTDRVPGYEEGLPGSDILFGYRGIPVPSTSYGLNGWSIQVIFLALVSAMLAFLAANMNVKPFALSACSSDVDSVS